MAGKQAEPKTYNIILKAVHKGTLILPKMEPLPEKYLTIEVSLSPQEFDGLVILTGNEDKAKEALRYLVRRLIDPARREKRSPGGGRMPTKDKHASANAYLADHVWETLRKEAVRQDVPVSKLVQDAIKNMIALPPSKKGPRGEVKRYRGFSLTSEDLAILKGLLGTEQTPIGTVLRDIAVELAETIEANKKKK